MGTSDHAAIETPEITALHLYRDHARFWEHVWQLITALSERPEHHTLSIAPTEGYRTFQRGLQARCREELGRFERAMSTADDLLIAKQKSPARLGVTPSTAS
jgi:hypothetical protein